MVIKIFKCLICSFGDPGSRGRPIL